MKDTKESKRIIYESQNENTPMKPKGIYCPTCNSTNYNLITCFSFIRCWNCGQVLDVRIDNINQ